MNATGLTPDLDQLLTIDPKAVISVKHINPHEGLQIKELNSWGDEVTPTSERLWTLTLDGDAVRAAEGPLAFHFPSAKAKDATMILQTYKDMNLTTLTEPVVSLGQTNKAGEIIAHPTAHPYPWLAIILFRKRSSAQPQSTAITFHMPAEVDGFAVVALLRRLRSSPSVKLKDTQQQELQSDLTRIEQQCFSSSNPMPESDLRTIASKWLRCAS